MGRLGTPQDPDVTQPNDREDANAIPRTVPGVPSFAEIEEGRKGNLSIWCKKKKRRRRRTRRMEREVFWREHLAR